MIESRFELLQALVDHAPDAVIVVDSSGRIEMANPAVEPLFGWRPEDLVGQVVELLIPEQLDQPHQRHRAAFVARPTVRPMRTGLVLLGRRRDGTTVPVDVSLAQLVLGGDQLVAAFVRDITDGQRSEEHERFVYEFSRRLLEGDPSTETLRFAASRVRSLATAAVAWVAELSNDASLTVIAADGDGAEVLMGAELPAGTSLSAHVMAGSVPVALEDMASDPTVLAQARSLGFGPALYLPLVAEERPLGVLVVARARGQVPFTPAEVRTLEAFASSVGIALCLAQARDGLELLRRASERDRIARDLHDAVIQRLFALGMSLQNLQVIAEGTVENRIGAAVRTIDDVIREIRETIFDLSRPDTGDLGIRLQLRQVITDTSQQLGFQPRVAFRGPVEATVVDELAPHLLAVVREALSNVARHAEAHAVEVVLQATVDSLVLSVADDGVGIPEPMPPTAGRGLANLSARADMFGGQLRLSRRRPAGTLLEWQVPNRVD